MEAVDNFTGSFRNDNMITIALETDGAEFTVQKATLCNASSYFLSALSNGFKESSDRKLRLPGCDSGVFKVFLYWHCCKKFPDFVTDLDDIEDELELETLTDERVILVIRVWTFGDAYLMPSLQNEAMECLNAIFIDKPATTNMIRQAYMLTQADSPIRKLFNFAARYEYMEGNLEEADLEALAVIPGFISDFVKPMKNFILENDTESAAFDERHPDSDEIKKYMV